MRDFDPSRYAPAFANLLSRERLNLLEAGRPDKDLRPQLEALAAPTAFSPHSSRDPNMAAACRAALWLYHDFLDEAHAISQDLHTAEGSFWHAIVHRREADYDNSKYWFRRVGEHPVFEPLCREAARLAAESRDGSAAFLTEQTRWDPFRFVDLCEAAVAGRAPCVVLCQQIQQREWELLFDYCYQSGCEI